MAGLTHRGRKQSIDARALLRLLVPGVLLAVLVAELAILLTRSFTTGMGQDFTSFYVAALTWLHGHI